MELPKQCKEAGCYRSLGDPAGSIVHVCVINPKHRREQQYNDMAPKGNTPKVEGPTTAAKNQMFERPCICGEFTSDPKYAFVETTFNCPKHGSVTVDRRMQPVPVLGIQPAAYPNWPYLPYTPIWQGGINVNTSSELKPSITLCTAVNDIGDNE